VILKEAVKVARRGDGLVLRGKTWSEWQRSKHLELSQSADAIVTEMKKPGRQLFRQEGSELSYQWMNDGTETKVRADATAVGEVIRHSVIDQDVETGELRVKIPFVSYSVKTPKKTRKPEQRGASLPFQD
jgi:hypothetical protein